jgi:hypothetical protein
VQADYNFHFLPDLKLTFNAGYDYSQSDGTVMFLPLRHGYLIKSMVAA